MEFLRSLIFGMNVVNGLSKNLKSLIILQAYYNNLFRRVTYSNPGSLNSSRTFFFFRTMQIKCRIKDVGVPARIFIASQ